MLKQYLSGLTLDQKPLGSLRSRAKTRMYVKLFCSACLGFCTFGVLPTIVPAIESKFAYDQATVAPKPSPRQKGTVTWHKTKATFYGTGDQKPRPGQINYDDGKKRKMANGAVYKSDGLTCAAWTGGSGERIPLGTKIEVRRGNVSLILTVTDRQRSRTNRYLDLPTKTWAKLGAKYSVGKVAVEWRKL